MCENGYYPSHKNGFIVLKRGKEVAKIIKKAQSPISHHANMRVTNMSS
ncbi:hypothetical protein K027_3085, partial [Acinetobacter baumannii 45057_1]